jgi:hypothetical protein
MGFNLGGMSFMPPEEQFPPLSFNSPKKSSWSWLDNAATVTAPMNPLLSAGLTAGGGLLKAFGLGGESWQEKMQKNWLNWLKQKRDQPLYSEAQISSFLPNVRAMTAGDTERIAGDVSRQTGLESGQGAGELARQRQKILDELLAQFMQTAMFENATAPLRYASAAGGLI